MTGPASYRCGMNSSCLSRMAAVFFVVLASFCTAQAVAAGSKSKAVWNLPAARPHPWILPDGGLTEAPPRFVILADRTGGHRPDIFEEAVARIRDLQPDFVMSVGDLIEGYSEQPAEITAMWDELLALLRPMGRPFFYVPGNHDLSNSVMEDLWKKRFGPAYYHFVHRDILFLCLNSCDGAQHRIGPAQVEWTRRILAKNNAVRWTIVFLHTPFWDEGPEKARQFEPIEEALASRPYTVFSGHHHEYVKIQRQGRDYYTLATTGGASDLAGPREGRFDHLTWVTVGEDGPRVRLMTLDGLLPDDVQTGSGRALRKALLPGGGPCLRPLFHNGQVLPDPVAHLTFNNTAAHTAHFTLQTQPLHGVILRQSWPASLTVQPGQTFDIPMEIVPPKILSPDPTPVASLTWRMQADTPEGPVDWRGRQDLVMAPLLPTSIAPAQAEADGSLGEWPSLPIVVNNPAQILEDAAGWQGPSDASFRFGVAQDQDYLWIAIEVTDDVTIADPSRQPWDQDGLEVRIDPRSPARQAQTGSAEEGRDFLLLALSPGQKTGHPGLYLLDTIPPGARYACVSHSGGYSAEIAIPLSWLLSKMDPESRQLRLNVQIDDRDHTPGTRAQLNWQPDWRSPAQLPGSGTFALRAVR